MEFVSNVLKYMKSIIYSYLVKLVDSHLIIVGDDYLHNAFFRYREGVCVWQVLLHLVPKGLTAYLRFVEYVVSSFELVLTYLRDLQQ